MKSLDKQMLDGNVETLILAVLRAGPSYGYAIVKDLNGRSKGILRMGEGTIYPVLYRLEEKKLVSTTWRTGQTGRKRKYYRLTAKGRKALVGKCEQWRRLASVMGEVLGRAGTVVATPAVRGVRI